MVSGDDERGQSVLIGSILLFGFLVIAFTGYQAVVVPNQNSDVEFEHFQDVENQFTSLHTNIVNAIESDTERAVRIDLGMRYPSRLIALNPPPVDGQLRTTAARDVTVADGSGQEITADVCGQAATSRSLVYSPGYNEFQNAQSITYENMFSARTYRDGAVYGEQRLVRNDNIDLLLLNGSVSETKGGTYSLNINGSHRYRKPGKVTDPTITLPTQFSAGVWNDEILEGQNGVTALQNGSNHVDLSFTGDYSISCAVAGLNDDPEFVPPKAGEAGVNKTFDTEWAEADGQPVNDDTVVGIQPDETITTTVEVVGQESRNPIEQLNVSNDLHVAGDTNAFDSFSFPGAQETDSNGQVEVNVTAAGSGSASVGDRFETYVTAGDDSDVLVFEIKERTMAERLQFQSGSGETFDNGNSGVRFTMENTGSDGTTVTEAALVSTTADATYVENRNGGDTFRTAGGTRLYQNRLDIGDSTTTLDNQFTISSGGEVTLELTQFRNENAPGGGQDRVGMGSQEVTVRFVFSDGSEGEYTIST
ncbi:hypothetical protein HWV23_03070 [Natronomonas halophila]|uniref:hypothetical protein n=1 Tax=Natronomonas halophila TaxID=2747817 RepID=UPI0015B44FFD|nr:hypothetical protein [Natronomonas halophila]QLD84735.1 hypothetical protein HWV23_03070 [Natronomonas halophila]